ncbi:MAG: hypothetical protein KF869_01515 [Phycisphaeraceae bacterium]|nr:hypothetical protein [Phycisphaeraceae bacterium]
MLTLLASLLWLGVLAAVVVFPVAMGMVASISPRLPDWVCRCGYPLVGLPVQGACPECGLSYNQHAWEPAIPEWGSGAERAALRCSPAAVALVVAAIGIQIVERRGVDDVAFLLVVAAAAAVPAIALSVFTPCRLPRVAAWMVALFGPVVGAVVGTFVYVDSANSSDAQAAIGMLGSVVVAAGLSGTFSGIVAIAVSISALDRQKQMHTARRRAVQAARRAALAQAATSPSECEPNTPL